jgi:alcohol dehydrogenase YqhD (iron-dependent ADH family)
MLDFRFHNDTEIIFGKDTEKATGEEVIKYAKKVLLCSYGDPHLEGIMTTIKSSLDGAGVDYCELSGIKPNPEEAKVYEGIDLVKKENIDFILAVGGGSVIDTAKAIAAGAEHDGDFWDLFTGEATFSKAIATGVVVTFPATGSESSNGSVVTNIKTGYKLAIIHNCLRPKFAILNPELTYSLPPYQTFCGVADIMSHVMERYFSSTTNTDVSDRLCESIIKAAIRNAMIVKETPDDYNARAEIMWAATLAHNDLVGRGRAEDWASHMIGMEIGAVYDSVHGATLAVLTPWWARYVYKNNVDRFVQFAMRVFDVEYDFDNPERTAVEGIDRLEAFFKAVELPTTLSEIGIETDEKFEEMSKKFFANGAIGSIKPLDDKDCYNILKMAQ